MDAGLVYVLDDCPQSREALFALLKDSSYRAQVFCGAEEFLTGCSRHPPLCAIVDINAPGTGGFELLEIIRQRGMSVPVIIVAAQADIPSAVQSIKRGAVDFLQKPYSFEMLFQAICEASQPLPLASLLPMEADQSEVRMRMKSLSRREKEILELIVAGKSSREIALMLDISTATVNNHRCQIKSKMNARTFAHLLAMLNSLGTAA